MSDWLKRFGVGAQHLVASPVGLPLGLYNLPRTIKGVATGRDESILPGDETTMDWARRLDAQFRENVGGVSEPDTFAENLVEFAPHLANLPGLASKLPAAAAKVVSSTPFKALFAAPQTIGGKATLGVVGAGGATAVQNIAEANAHKANSLIDPRDASSELIDPRAAQPNQLTDDERKLLLPFPMETSKTTALVDPRSDEGQSWTDYLNWQSAAGIAGALVLAKLGKNALTAKSARRAAQEPSVLTGLEKPEPLFAGKPISDVATRLEAGFVDVQAPAAKLIDPSTELGQKALNAISLQNTTSINEKIGHFERTGELSGVSGIAIPVPKQFYDVAATLSPEKMQILKDRLAALDEIDNRAKSARQVAAGKTPITKNAANVPDADLLSMSRAGVGDPVIDKLAGWYQQIMRGMLQYMHQKGKITSDKYNQLLSDHPNYMPELAGLSDNPIDKLVDAAASSKGTAVRADFTNLFKREGGRDKFLNPLDAMEQYVKTIIRDVETDDMRKLLVTAIRRGSPDGKRLFEVAKESSKDTVTYRVAGKERHWQVKNSFLLEALRNNPDSVLPAMNAVRRAVQFPTTGGGNPAWAPIGTMMDAFAGTVLAPKGSKPLGMFRGDLVGALAETGTGVVQGLYGRAMRAASAGLLSSIEADGVTAKMLGPAAKPLADWAGSMYANSMQHLFERLGTGGAARFSEEMNTRQMFSTLRDLSPDYASHSPVARKLWTAYMGTLDAIQNGARLRHMAINYKPGMTDTQLNTLARQTRDLTGDFTRRPGGKYGTLFAEAVPYGNVSIQSARQFLRMLRDQPGTTIPALMLSSLPVLGVALYSSALGPEYREHFFNNRTPGDRARRIPLYVPGQAPEDAARMTLPPELALFTNAFVTLMSGALGIDSGEIFKSENAGVLAAVEKFVSNKDERLTEAMKQMGRGTLSAVDVGVPPLIAGAANVAGYRASSGPLGLSEVRPISGERISGDDDSITTLPGDANLSARAIHNATVTNLAATFGGATARTMMVSLQAFERGQRETGVFSKGVKEAGQQLSLETGRTVSYLPGVWTGASARLSTDTPEHRALTDKLKALEKLATAQSSETGEGMTGKGKYALPSLGDQPDLFVDPGVRRIQADAVQVFNDVQKNWMAQIGALQKQLDSVLNGTDRSATQRDAARQMLVSQIQEKTNDVLEVVRDYEDMLSQRYGVRIRFQNLSRRTRLDDLAPIREN